MKKKPLELKTTKNKVRKKQRENKEVVNSNIDKPVETTIYDQVPTITDKNGSALVFFPDNIEGLFLPPDTTMSMTACYDQNGVLQMGFATQQSVFDSTMEYFKQLDSNFEAEIGNEYQLVMEASKDKNSDVLHNYFHNKKVAIVDTMCMSLKKQILDVICAILFNNFGYDFVHFINNEAYKNLESIVDVILVSFRTISYEYILTHNFDFYCMTIRNDLSVRIVANISEWLYDIIRYVSYSDTYHYNQINEKDKHKHVNEAVLYYDNLQAIANHSMQQLDGALEFIFSQVVLFSFRLDSLYENIGNRLLQ